MTVPLVPPPTSTHVPPHTGVLAFLRRVNGENGSLPSLKEARASTFTEADLEKISRFKPTHGTPKRVHRELTDLASRLDADDLMIPTIVGDHALHRRSYERIAEVFGWCGKRAVRSPQTTRAPA
jgi:hypothetical protein